MPDNFSKKSHLSIDNARIACYTIRAGRPRPLANKIKMEANQNDET
nr:MAG TPA: hypothetical protein [Caudoviricetes sp.]